MLFRAAYGVTGPPTFEEKAYVLKLPTPLADVAKEQKMTEDELLAKLAAMQGEAAPGLRGASGRSWTRRCSTAWNGQMIAGLAVAGQTFKEPEYTKAAARAAEFVLANLRTRDGRLLRTYGRAGDGKPGPS